MSKECTLTNDELIEKCNQWVSKLSKSGGKDWCLRVPVDFNNDPDMLFCELGKRLKETDNKLIEVKKHKINLSKEVEQLEQQLIDAGLRKPAIRIDLSHNA